MPTMFSRKPKAQRISVEEGRGEAIFITANLPQIFEKDKVKMKVLLKAPKKSTGGFHEKKEKNKKVNLGGPGKTKPRKTKSRNRGIERARDKKRKDKGK